MPVYVSDRLTATLGVVRGSPTPTRLIQWFRGSTVIAGASASTYTITSDDLGQPISVRQTESNYFGSAVATSAATEDVEVFSPSILFSASEPGVWFDPTDAANLAWRRNLLLWTEQFDNAAWVKANGGVGVVPVVTANAGTDPIGGSTADRVQFSLGGGTASGDISQLRQTVQTDSVSTYTFSFYAKSFDGSSSYQMIAFGAASAAQVVAVTGAWTRFTFTGFGPNLNYSLTLRGGQTPTNSNTADILLWGAQLEQSTTATTYQPITNLNNEVIAQFPNATLYQDSIGTTPVYSPEQPVGLMLDKSKGLVLGPELVTNGDFASGAAGWTLGAGWSWASGKVQNNGSATGQLRSDTALPAFVVGRTYITEFDAIITTSSVGQVYVGGAASGGVSTSGHYRRYVVATSALADSFVVSVNGGFVGSIDNISVKELPGNHATQSTAISRPLYGIVPVSGRRNLLTWTEQFDNAVWVKFRSAATANAAVAPDGTTTADKLVPAASLTTGFTYYNGALVLSNGTVTTASVYVKAAELGFAFIANNNNASSTASGVCINLSTGALTNQGGSGTYSAVSVGNGWWRVSSTSTTSGGGLNSLEVNPLAVAGTYGSYTGDGTSGILTWGAQLEVGSTATAYQKVTNDYDVTEAGVASVGYLRFDGTNDFMLTSTITPGTNKVQVFSGVRKLSDAGISLVAETSTNSTSAGGAFYLGAPATATANYTFASMGTVPQNAQYTNAAVAAPVTNVVTGLGDISADLITLRVNSTQVVQTTLDQGTGNYLAYQMYLGRRAGTSLELNGQLFPLIVRFGPNMSSALIRTTENWVASKTAGVVLP